VVALTKSDLADEEWLLMVREDIQSRLSGTPLAASPIVEVSALTGSGLDALLSELDKAAQRASGRIAEPASRLYIDRAFTITGHGTVVTGTLLGGNISEGDKLELLTSMKQVRVKQAEVHDEKAQVAERGQRVALNLAGTDKMELERGMALATPGWLEPTSLIDAEVVKAPESPDIGHGDRLRLHIGTSEVICRARVPKDQPEGALFIQLETETPIFPARGDRFILRTYSPQQTIGGGTVLLAAAPRRKVGLAGEARSISDMSPANPACLSALSRAISRKEAGADAASWPVEEGLFARRAYIAREVLRAAAAAGSSGLVALKADDAQDVFYMDADGFTRAAEEAASVLSGFHREHPLRRGMPKEELRQKVTPAADRKGAVALFAAFTASGRFASSSDLIWLAAHEVRLDDKSAAMALELERAFSAELLGPPDPEVLLKAQGPGSPKVMEYLLDQGILVKASSDVTFHRDAVTAALKAAAKLEGPFTAALLRDALGTSRKYAIAMLEWMDSKEYTQRSGDTRTLKSHYKEAFGK
jgi:selenocysteine-specific elongation factor